MKQGWCSGKSTRLPPLWPWIDLLCVGLYGLSLSVFLQVFQFSSFHRNQHSKFQFDLELVVKKPPCEGFHLMENKIAFHISQENKKALHFGESCDLPQRFPSFFLLLESHAGPDMFLRLSQPQVECSWINNDVSVTNVVCTELYHIIFTSRPVIVVIISLVKLKKKKKIKKKSQLAVN